MGGEVGRGESSDDEGKEEDNECEEGEEDKDNEVVRVVELSDPSKQLIRQRVV